MATKKITITLHEGQVDQIRGLVDLGTASSVSGFVQHAVGLALDDVAGWGALLANALRDTGGELWGWHGLTDIQQVGHAPRKDVQDGDDGTEEAPSSPLVHLGVQG